MNEYLRQYELSNHNFADAMTAYLIELHNAANNKLSRPNPEIAIAVRSQAINMVAQMAQPE